MSENAEAPKAQAENVPSEGALSAPTPGRLVRAALIALAFAVAALLSIHDLNSYDVWTHLAIGRLMWEEDCIPDHEPFSYTQNRQMTLDEAAPQYALRESVKLRKPQTLPEAPPFELVAAAGTLVDNDLKAKLKKAGIPLSELKLKVEPPLKRLVGDALDGGGVVVLRDHTLLTDEAIEKLRRAGIREVPVTVPWVNHEWLFQVGAYLSYKAWGMPGAIYYKTAILLLACLFVLLAGYRSETHVVGIAAVFLAAIVSYKRFYMRPEVMSILFCAVWVYMLERFRHRQQSWSLCVWLPLLMVVWINTHGYFILGPVIMLIYLIGEGIQGYLPLPRSLVHGALRLKDDLITGRGWAILGVATLLTVVATFVNPYGIDGARYPIDVLQQVVDPTSVIRTVIGEMQPPWIFGFTYAVSYTWVLIFVSGASWILNYRRVKLSRLILYGMSIAFMSAALRNMPFFGIPGAVYLALNVNEAWPDTIGFLREKVIPEALLTAKWVSQAALAALLIFFILWIPSDRFHIYDVASTRFGTAYTTEKFSMGAIEFIHDHPIKGNLFNSFGMGGLCMWKLFPEKRPGPNGEPRDHYSGPRLFIDGRAEMYGGPFVKDYTASLVRPELWKQLDAKFQFGVVFLNWEAGDTHEMMLRLYRDPDWELCYGDGTGYVWVRRTPENMPVIDEARRVIESPQFVDTAPSYRLLGGILPGVPTHREFVGFQDTIWSYAKVLNADPKLADDARRVSEDPGVVLFDRRYMTNTYDRFRRYVPILPKRVISPGDMVGRAGFALRMGLPDLAEAILKGLENFYPESPEFHVHQATIHKARGGYKQSQKLHTEAASDYRMAFLCFKAAENLYPSYPGLTLSLLEICDVMGDPQGTAFYLRKALNSSYPTLQSTGLLAGVCLKHGKPRLALQQLEAAIRLIPERDASPFYQTMASCYLDMRDLRKSLENVQKALDLDDTNAPAWCLLGKIYFSVRDMDKARIAFERCLAVDPKFRPAEEFLRHIKNPPSVPPGPPFPQQR